MKSGAVISECGQYRYRLERELASTGPVYAFFGVNPSTADATVNDATVKKWIGFSKRWGVSRFIVGNAFPLRSTDVRGLAMAPHNLEAERDNLRHILQMADEADVLVPCWGDRKKVPPSMHKGLDDLMVALVGTGKPVMHLGVTKGGDPRHPLMLGYDTPLQPWAAALKGAQ